jgi:hypothetical protein
MTKTYNYPSILENIVNTSKDKLNDWELQFVSNVYNRTLKGQGLSKKQEDTILKINRKCLSRS